MNKILLAISFIVLSCNLAVAEPAKFLFQNATSVGHSVILSTGTGLETRDSTITCTYTESGGTVTAMAIDLLGTIGDFDGTEYDVYFTHTFSAGEITNSRATFHSLERYGSGFKTNINSVTKTGSFQATCKMARYRPGKH